jgi:cytosine deaminase
MAETVLRGALVDGHVRDVMITDGIISAVEELGRTDGALEVDLSGYVLLPSAVEAHAHLDKAFLGDRVPNAAGDLDGAIAGMYAYQTTADVPEITARAVRAGRLMARNGYTAIRTHVDVTTSSGLIPMEAVVAARRELVDVVDVEIVALIGSPMTGPAGGDHRRLLAAALEMGADLVGGCPHLEPDGTRVATEYLLSVAAGRGVGVDLHTDETLDPEKLGLVDLIDAVDAGFAYPVTASHCVSLGSLPLADQTRIAADLARTGIGVVTNPATNLYLQGRGVETSTPRGLTAIAALREAGVAVAAGQDNVQDPFNPLGRADPFEIAGLMVLVGHLTVDDAYAAVSGAARAVLGIPDVRVAPGRAADLLAVRAGSLREAIAFAPNGPDDRLVFRRGVRA